MSETGSSGQNLLGIGYIVGGVGFLSAMDAVAKILVGADYSVLQILAIRGWIIAAGLALFLPNLGGFAALKSNQPYKHTIRILVGAASPFFFFSALKDQGLAEVTVIFFGGATFLMTALSALLFREKVGPHRWGAVIVGFIGIVIAARPGDGVLEAGSFQALAAGATYALMVLTTRWIGPSEGAFRPVFYYNFGMAVFASIALPFVFKPMPMGDSATLGLLAVLAVLGHFGVTRAFQTASVSLLAPFEYTSMLWAALLGYLLWAEIPTANVLVGAAIIFVCGLYLLHRESHMARTATLEETAPLAVDPLFIAVPDDPSDTESFKP